MDSRISFNHLVISNTPGLLGLRDTLQNSAKLLEMLEYMRLTDELTLDAEYGVFLTLETVVDALRYVSSKLEDHSKSTCHVD